MAATIDDGNPLSRTLTFSYNTLPAASLPLELQQEIYSYLDSHSFNSARKVCRWWRLASFDTVTLARQLQLLPIKPTVDPRKTDPRELHRLFCEAERTLLLGYRVSEKEHEEGTVLRSKRAGLLARPKIAAVTRGDKTVTINGGVLALFDTASDPPKVLVQRPLNDIIGGARQVPWLQIAPASSYAMALSSDGGLLAVAQERTVQIYDLSAGVNGQTTSKTVASAAGHYIQGLDFEQDDHVLRVQLSDKGVVLYLGTPNLSPEPTHQPAKMSHWTSRAGLRHLFLDSSLLQLPNATAAAGTEHYAPRLSGLQLLRPFQNGHFFAAQKHGGDESSHYIYGHVRHSPPTASLPPAVEPASLTELARLESFLSAWDHVKDCYLDGNGLTRCWEGMPSAHEHHPRFALSDDGEMLVLAEREKKRVRHVKWTQGFVYRVPSLGKVGGKIEEGVEREGVRWKRLARFLDGEGRGGGGGGEGRKEERAEVARVPVSLGTMEGEASEVRVERCDGGDSVEYDVAVATGEKRGRWSLVET